MSGYTYSEYIEAISAALESPITDASSAAPFVDPSYNQFLPRAIEAGEQRIYRELDLLGTYEVDPSGVLAPNQRRFTLPSALGTFVVVTQVSVMSPAGTRNQLDPVSKEFIDAAWPTDTAAFTPSVPQVWSPFDQASIFIGPAADVALQVEVTGTVRPPPLSSTNTTTIASQYFPDGLLYATLVVWCGYQRSFPESGIGDDSAMAVSWEKSYQTAMGSATIEQARIRFASQGWSARQPARVASPPQT